MKALMVIQSAYRCTVEEQDDPAVWITHAMKGAGGDLAVLLRGNAVNYAVQGQDASGLSFGDLRQTQPPQIDRDVSKLLHKGVPVYMVAEDADVRGISSRPLVAGVEKLARGSLPGLFSKYDQIWHW